MITITDPGPTRDSYGPGANQPNHQPSGRITALSLAANGSRMYAGSFAGVWRSDDGGRNWFQLTRPQPGLGVVEAEVPGALLAPHVFDLVASPTDPDVVLVSAVDSQFRISKDGVYRTADGGASWTLVLPTTAVCNIAFAPDNGKLAYAALGYVIAISQDAGATWTYQGAAGVYASHIAVGPLEPDGKRRVYAEGYNTIWCSTDGGATWTQDSRHGRDHDHRRAPSPPRLSERVPGRRRGAGRVRWRYRLRGRDSRADARARAGESRGRLPRDRGRRERAELLHEGC